MPLPHGYHFTLEIGGVTYPFMLPDPRRLVASDLSPFTQRTSSGGLTLADLHHQGAFEQRTFSGGMGQAEMIEQTRYLDGTNLDTRMQGVVSLFTTTQSVAIAAPTARLSLASDDTYLYLGGTGGVFAWDGSSTSTTNISTGLPNTNVLAIFHNGSYLFAGLSGASLYRFTGTVGAPAWTNVSGASVGDGAPRNASVFCVHDGYFWHAQADSNLIHYWSQEDGSDAEGDADTNNNPTHPLASANGDLGAVEIGPNGREVKALASYQGNLYAFRDDGVWRLRLESAADGTLNYVAYREFSFVADSRNCVGVTVWNGALWFNAENRIYRYTGATLTDFTNPAPTDTTATYPPERHAPVHALLGIRGSLYAFIKDHLYAFDGTSWHRLAGPLQAGSSGAGVLAHFGASSKLCGILTTSGADPTLWYWVVSDEYSRGPYAESGELTTSWFDGGFLDIPKAWLNLRVLAMIAGTSLSATSVITVTAYNRERNSESTAYVLGTINISDGTGRVLRDFEMPDGLKGKAIQFKFVLEGDPNNLNTTPLLYGYMLEYVLRPKTVWGYAPVLRLTDNMETADGRRDPYNVKAKLDLLREARASVIPLRYEDYLGNRNYVYVSAIRMQPINVATDTEHAEVEVSLSLVSVDKPFVVDIPSWVTERVSTGYEMPALNIEGTLEVYDET
jgi:hypothetical protein